MILGTGQSGDYRGLTIRQTYPDLGFAAPGELTPDWAVEGVTVASCNAGALMAREIEPLPLFDQLAV